MKKKCLIFLTIVIFGACSSTDLDRTIFIPDEDDPILPAYTEWGYNSFGAKYERDYFLSSNYIVPCKILYNNGLLYFSLNGRIRENKEMTLLIIFPFSQMVDYKDLMQLHDLEIALSDDFCEVKILQDGKEDILDVISGKLHFKRVHLLSIDDIENRVILSGVFHLNFRENIFQSTISNGRFDLGINNNFFESYL